MVDVKARAVYFEVVPDRKAETLLAIIHQHVLPNSIVYSDKWSAYNNICKLGMEHQTVNHSYNYVDPDTLTCTNTIESLWNACKQKFKEMRGCTRAYIQSHIDEFMWRHNNRVTREEAFDKLLTSIASVYPISTTE